MNSGEIFRNVGNIWCSFSLNKTARLELGREGTNRKTLEFKDAEPVMLLNPDWR
jgi:hypothetical protein